jgi:hypothetical protein
MDDGVASPSSSARRTLASTTRARPRGGGTDSPIVTRQGDPFVRTHESPRVGGVIARDARCVMFDGRGEGFRMDGKREKGKRGKGTDGWMNDG